MTHSSPIIDPMLIRESASEVVAYFRSERQPSEGSFAARVLSDFQDMEFNPLLSILEYPQHHLLIAADSLGHIAASRINFENSTSREPLPLFAFHALARIAVESSVMATWLVNFKSDEDAVFKALAIMNKNFQNYETYSNVRNNLEDTYLADADYSTFSLLKQNTQQYAKEHGIRMQNPPSMTSKENETGLLELAGGKQLELLYIQLSSVVHANSWTFGLNAKRTGDEKASGGSISTVTYSADENLLSQVLSVATGLLNRSLRYYRDLFEKVEV